MPEFEEPAENSNSQQNYTPSTDASKKPRTRRRSGGFKTEQPTTDLSIGEVDPVKALKEEKLSGAAKPAPEKREERPARRADAPKKRSESRSPRSRDSDERPRGNAQPSPETLAAIAAVEARLDERRKERDARRAERDKTRPARSDKTPQSRQKGSGKKKQSGGIIDSILSFFGLGPKQPAKKTGGKGRPSGNQGKGGGRPRGKGGQGGNRGDRSQNRSGGKGRRSGGGKRPRRNDNRNRSEQS